VTVAIGASNAPIATVTPAKAADRPIEVDVAAALISNRLAMLTSPTWLGNIAHVSG
jgi:hypothetical protein